MREIKFRGKRVDGLGWIYGHYVTMEHIDEYGFCEHMRGDGLRTQYAIIEAHFGGQHCDVHPETVCQYTGLKDKNGTEIYEGDIVMGWGGVSAFGVHEFQGDYTLNDIRHIDYEELGNYDELYIIGNIHDKEAK